MLYDLYINDCYVVVVVVFLQLEDLYVQFDFCVVNERFKPSDA